jgi:hypothetical protein
MDRGTQGELMPERVQVVTMMAEREIGVQVWHGGTGRCQSMKTSDYVAAQIRADELYVDIVGRINWNRILLMAKARHVYVHKGDGDATCGHCLQDAMLALDYAVYDWPPDSEDYCPRNSDHLKEGLAETLADEERHPWFENMDFPELRAKKGGAKK